MAVEDVFVNGASGTLKRLVSVASSEISLAWGVKDELKKLVETFELIDAVTYDAEMNQVNNAEVSLWLKWLKEAAYDADDILDEISYEAMRRSTLNLLYSKIKKLPRNIGSLRNLRSLKISKTLITEIPDSICCIHSLQKFEFSSCLSIRVLPSNFGALTQLRSLHLGGTSITELPDSLTSNICKLESVGLGRCKIPIDIKNWVELRYLCCGGEIRGVEMLSRLEILNGYSVRKVNNLYSSGIKELAHLNSLRELTIRRLENVKGKIDAERAKLKDKQHIRKLSLVWYELVDNNNSATVLDGLQPHPNLKELRIGEFHGLNFPKWIVSSSCLPNLVELHLSYCDRCEKLPALGMLPCLQVLSIEEMNSVKCLGEEFYYQEEDDESKGSATAKTTSFPSLIDLRIDCMRNLETWVTPPPPHNSFPVLEVLYLRWCNRLTSVPDFQSWTSLRKFKLL